MDTTLAAAKARRTVGTIRTWCRKGVIAATKQSGKWVVEFESLEYRISLDKPATPRPLTAEMIEAIGGRRWKKAGYDRVYVNVDEWAPLVGIEVTRYGTGRISSATISGRGIANGRAMDLLGAVAKVWFDTADGRLHARHSGARELEIRYLSGERDTIDLVDRIFKGIAAAARAA